MSFDDFQYQNINQYILDLKLKPKKVKQQKSSSLGSSLDGSISDSDDEDSDPKVVKREQQALFNDEEILDIEEAQDKNVFGDVQEELEENYLQIESEMMEELELRKKNKKNDDFDDDHGKNKPFNHVGIRTMINIHEHLEELIKSQYKDQADYLMALKKNQKKSQQKKRKNQTGGAFDDASS